MEHEWIDVGTKLGHDERDTRLSLSSLATTTEHFRVASLLRDRPLPQTSETTRVRFNTINRKTGNRVKRQFIDQETEDVVDTEHQVKGYAVGKNSFITVEDEELDAIKRFRANQWPEASCLRSVDDLTSPTLIIDIHSVTVRWTNTTEAARSDTFEGQDSVQDQPQSEQEAKFGILRSAP